MHDRFFEKSKNIDAISEQEVYEFLRKEKIKAHPDRVIDFYNSLSALKAEGSFEEIDNDKVNYDQFGCKTEEDIKKISNIKSMEKDYMDRVNPETLDTGDRLLKAACALAYEFEKSLYGGDAPPDPNQYLRNLFSYSESKEIEDKPATFGEILELDISFLKYIALLSSKKAFRKTGGTLVRTESGRKTKMVVMDSLSEVFKMDLTQAIMPDFNKKLATNELMVRARFEYKEKAQNLIILVDDSSSMARAEKKAMLKAALTLKLNDLSDVHTIYIGTFEEAIYGFQKIEKGTVFSDLRKITLSHGGTDVNGCVKETIEQIKKRKLQGYGGTDLPLSEDSFEILVINDGQDAVDKTYHPSIKLHALCLQQSNPDLKNICHRSGGTYFHLDGK